MVCVCACVCVRVCACACVCVRVRVCAYMRGIGFRCSGYFLGFGVWGLGFRVGGSRLGVWYQRGALGLLHAI